MGAPKWMVFMILRVLSSVWVVQLNSVGSDLEHSGTVVAVGVGGSWIAKLPMAAIGLTLRSRLTTLLTSLFRGAKLGVMGVLDSL